MGVGCLGFSRCGLFGVPLVWSVLVSVGVGGVVFRKCELSGRGEEGRRRRGEKGKREEGMKRGRRKKGSEGGGRREEAGGRREEGSGNPLL